MQNKQPRGFTLIELLVVIAIIGILASIVLVSLNSARAKGRDAKRVAELTQMARVIALHPSVDTSTGFSTCTTAYSAVSTCTSPDLSQFNDPSGATTGCTGSPTAACDYSVSNLAGTGAPLFNNWQIKTWIEGPTGSFTAAGEVCISSTDATPYRTGCN